MLQLSYRSQDAYSFDRVCTVSTCHQQFAFAQLLYTYLMAYTTFSSSLTTTTFNSSSMKRFIHSACTACMRGLLSSIKQHVKELFTLSLLDTPCASMGEPGLAKLPKIVLFLMGKLLNGYSVYEFTYNTPMQTP